MKTKLGKKIHLCEYEANELAKYLNLLFDKKFEVPRIRAGKRQKV